MYTLDSFFTLTYPGQIGLVIVSLLLTAFFLWLALWVARRTLHPVRLLVSIVLFALFLWLTPQLYYTYYYFVFENLPLQWVLKTPPTPAELGRLLAFSGPSDMSAHSKGILGWLMIILPQLVAHKSRKPSAKTP